MQNTKRYKEYLLNPDEELLITPHPEEYLGELTIQELKDSFDITLTYPVHFKKAKTLRIVEFGFRIEVRSRYDEEQDRNIWNI